MGLDDTIISASRLWNIDVKRVIKDQPIAGSPERCEFRCVVQDVNNDLFVLESLIHDDVAHKQTIVRVLNFLSKKGMETVQPYMPGSGGEYILGHRGRFWQVIPFIDGVSPDRPNYVFDKWRGKPAADFLIQLRAKSAEVPNFTPSHGFSIKHYIAVLLNRIEAYEPDLFKDVRPIADFLLREFMGVHDALPVAFCHGDYHSLNIIWSKTGINAVIDWEFLGVKPEIYDVANMIGCIGVEAPESLVHDFVGDFIFYLKKAGVIAAVSWEYLFEFVLALRFAWLSEWLRHNDREMIELETTYMTILMKNYGNIRDAWAI